MGSSFPNTVHGGTYCNFNRGAVETGGPESKVIFNYKFEGSLILRPLSKSTTNWRNSSLHRTRWQEAESEFETSLVYRATGQLGLHRETMSGAGGSLKLSSISILIFMSLKKLRFSTESLLSLLKEAAG